MSADLPAMRALRISVSSLCWRSRRDWTVVRAVRSSVGPAARSGRRVTAEGVPLPSKPWCWRRATGALGGGVLSPRTDVRVVDRVQAGIQGCRAIVVRCSPRRCTVGDKRRAALPERTRERTSLVPNALAETPHLRLDSRDLTACVQTATAGPIATSTLATWQSRGALPLTPLRPPLQRCALPAECD